jgi:hypothetical protein
MSAVSFRFFDKQQRTVLQKQDAYIVPFSFYIVGGI